MSRVFPSHGSPITDSSAERDLYHALANQLDGDWVVIHSLPWLNNEGMTLSSGECDFLVLHPQHGMLAIEAKTGDLAPDRATGKWRSANGTLIQDPVRQAERSIHHLERELASRLPSWRNDSENKLPFGHAVALPHTRALPQSGMLPPHVKPDLFILENDMADLDKRLRSILSRHDRRRSGDAGSRMPPEIFETVIKAFLPEFRIVPSLASRLREESAEMARLTAQQSFFLQCCRFAPRLAVYGTSGSGKTLLACEEALLHDADGARVLFLCYNRNLAEHVDSRLNDDGASGVKVATFHALCREVVESAGMRYDVPAGREEVRRFFDEISPELFMDALPAYAPRYDAILVDEMQDFQTTWWVCIGELLRDPSRSLLHIFGDPGQNLYDREMEPPFREPAITLPVNCRNTRAIAEWIAAATGIVTTASEWGPVGGEPQCVPVHTEREEVDAVRKLLHRLVYDEKIDPGRIVILGPHALGNCSLGAQRIIGPYYVAEALSPYKTSPTGESGTFDIPPDKTRIRYSTIHSFKSLEADIVILLESGMREGVHGDEKTLTYVGASRARHRLFVVRQR